MKYIIKINHTNGPIIHFIAHFLIHTNLYKIYCTLKYAKPAFPISHLINACVHAYSVHSAMRGMWPVGQVLPLSESSTWPRVWLPICPFTSCRHRKLAIWGGDVVEQTSVQSVFATIQQQSPRECRFRCGRMLFDCWPTNRWTCWN